MLPVTNKLADSKGVDVPAAKSYVSSSERLSEHSGQFHVQLTAPTEQRTNCHTKRKPVNGPLTRGASLVRRLLFCEQYLGKYRFWGGTGVIYQTYVGSLRPCKQKKH